MGAVCGIIAEYNPFHNGHKYHIAETRKRLSTDTAIICLMSGNVTQRGEFALLPKHQRAAAAVNNGADLVLELPARVSLSSAEGFAQMGVYLLKATGLASHLSFGSECGDADALRRAALLIEDPGFKRDVAAELKTGVSYPAARASAAKRTDLEAGNLLCSPNDILGVEYMKALMDSQITALAVTRTGTGHDSDTASGGFASASMLRKMLLQNEDISAFVPNIYELRQCFDKGLAPAVLRNAPVVFRRLSLDDWRNLRDVTEGLENRLFRAARQAVTAEEFFSLVKTKRYTLSRIRRIAMRAFLGLYGEDSPPAYLRVLALNETGQNLLHRMKKTASLPIITKPAAHKELLTEETAVTAQFGLCLPVPMPGGWEMTTSGYLSCI